MGLALLLFCSSRPLISSSKRTRYHGISKWHRLLLKFIWLLISAKRHPVLYFLQCAWRPRWCEADGKACDQFTLGWFTIATHIPPFWSPAACRQWYRFGAKMRKRRDFGGSIADLCFRYSSNLEPHHGVKFKPLHARPRYQSAWPWTMKRFMCPAVRNGSSKDHWTSILAHLTEYLFIATENKTTTCLVVILGELGRPWPITLPGSTTTRHTTAGLASSHHDQRYTRCLFLHIIPGHHLNWQ